MNTSDDQIRKYMPLVIIFGALLFIMSIPAFFASKFLGIFFFIVGAILLFIGGVYTKKEWAEINGQSERKIKERQEKLLEEQIQEKEKLKRFLGECQITPQTDLDDPRNYTVIKRIADMRNIKYEDFDTFYNGIKNKTIDTELTDEEKNYIEDKKDRQLEKEIDKYLKENKGINELLHYTGNDKTRKMIEFILNPEKANVEAIKRRISSLGKESYQQLQAGIRETHDSALLGGIAAGIAGSAFGTGIYLEEERKNASAREYNTQLAQAIFAAEEVKRTELYEKQKEAALEYSKKRSALGKYEQREVDRSISDKDLLKRINFGTPRVKISRSGGIFFEISGCVYSFTGTLTINRKPAVIDGAINVLVKKDDQIICTLPLILPLEGIGSSTTVLRTAKKNAVKKEDEKTYKYEFEARDLWLVEKVN